jgi:hypothetical protein
MKKKKPIKNKLNLLQILQRMELFTKENGIFMDRIEKKLHEIQDLEIEIQKNQIENTLNMTEELSKQNDVLLRFKTGIQAIEHAIFGVPGDPNQPGIVQRCILHAEKFATIDTFIRGHEHETAVTAGELIGEKDGIQKGKLAKDLTIKLWQMILGVIATIILSGVLPIFLARCVK